MPRRELIAKILLLAVLLPLTAALETSVFSALPILGVVPFLLIYPVAAAAMYEGPAAGIACGLAAGILMDGLGDKSLCLYTVQFVLWGGVIGAVSPSLFRTRTFTAVIWGSAAGFLMTFLRFFVKFYLFSQAPFSEVFTVILPQTLYSALISPLLIWPVAGLHRHFARDQGLFR